MAPYVLSSLSYVAFFFILIAVPKSHSEAAEILYFEAWNARTGGFVSRIKLNSIIAVDFPITIIPVTKGRVQNVTFYRPQPFTATLYPFALLGMASPLSHGKRRVTAFVNGNPNKMLDIYFFIRHKKWPLYGPLTSSVPLRFSNSKFKTVFVPNSTCRHPKPMIERFEQVYFDLYSYRWVLLCESNAPIAFETDIRTCSKGAYRYRETRMSYNVDSQSKSGSCNSSCQQRHSIQYTVVDARTFQYSKGWYNDYSERMELRQLERSRCAALHEARYFEVCFRFKGKIECETSIVAVPNSNGTLITPLLRFRPPIEIRIAPEDKVSVSMRAILFPNPLWFTHPFATGLITDGAVKPFSLQLHAQSLSGQLIASSARYPDSKLFSLPLKNPENGTTVFFDYGYASCPDFRASGANHYSTTIIVDKSVKRLIKQDVRLPTFPEPTLKPTALGDPFNVTVYAKNEGGGLREGGAPTELTYQWYVLEDIAYGAEIYPKRLVGETEPVLHIPYLYFRYYQWGHSTQGFLQILFVDVCNTFGCKRSVGLDTGTLLDDYSPDPGHCYWHSDCQYWMWKLRNLSFLKLVLEHIWSHKVCNVSVRRSKHCSLDVICTLPCKIHFPGNSTFHAAPPFFLNGAVEHAESGWVWVCSRHEGKEYIEVINKGKRLIDCLSSLPCSDEDFISLNLHRRHCLFIKER